MERDPILIVGAGLAGLSAAYHLGRRPYLLVEAEPSVGGLCRSVREGGFTFDQTGHLLHLKRPEIRKLVFRLTGEGAFLKIDRRSGIYSNGVYTDYPFQVNTHGLPLAVVRECVMGFAEKLQRPVPLKEDPSFEEWALATFGQGISRYFMLPYNRKLFCSDLDTITADWVSWSIPKPTWEDVIRGAQGTNRKAFGYNPSFLYPAAGGMDHLARAFLPHVRPPALSTRVSSVNAARRQARLSSGEVFSWSSLISTMPLPDLFSRIGDAPQEIRGMAGELRYVAVLNLNLGFDAPCRQPYHWIYFPEPDFPFYRVGVYSNLCPATVPADHSAYYVEISHPPGEKPEIERLAEASAEALRRIGLVAESAKVCQVHAIDIPCAYVIHDRARRERLPVLFEYLEQNGILSIGRYGAWEYSAMEDAMWQGRLAAERA